MTVPKCGFIEREDGSIEWGSTWEPGPYSGPEPICIEYRLEDCGAWIPFATWTRDPPIGMCSACHLVTRELRDTSTRCRWCGKDSLVIQRSLSHHDCDWIEREQTLYHHCSGGGGRAPSVGGFSDPVAMPGRIWIADGVSVRDDKRVLTDADLLAMGYRRVHGPTPDPFADAIEGETFYDERTGERVPDEDGLQCGVCEEMFVVLADDLIVVNEHDATDEDIAGLYRPAGSRCWGGTWVCPLPYNIGDQAEDICPKCSAQALADYGLHDLLLAWQADREGMPEQLREALLDGMRERVDQWVAGYPAYRTTRVHDVFAATLAMRLGVSPDDAHVLCEDAGYGGSDNG